MTGIKVCLLGLGNIGRNVLPNLSKNGFDVHPYDPFTAKDRFQSPKMAADGCDFVIVAVLNSQQVKDALFNEDNGAMTCGTKPKLVICLSTVPPSFSKTVGEKLAKMDVMYVDAPISGGAEGARLATLTIMAAGPERDLKCAQKVLSAIGNIAPNVGNIWGNGSSLKAVNQCLVGLNNLAAAEGLVIASRLGLDPQMVYNVISGCNTAGNSWILSNKGQRIVKLLKGKTPTSDGSLRIWLKDLGIVKEECTKLGLKPTMTHCALDSYQKAVDMGLGKLDDTYVCKIYDTTEPHAKRAKCANYDHVETKCGSYMLKTEYILGNKIWTLDDEPGHKLIFRNVYCNVYSGFMNPGESTFFHAHRYDSLYIFFSNTSTKMTSITKQDSVWCDCCTSDKVETGEVRYGYHNEIPLIHKVTCVGPGQSSSLDAELVRSPPKGSIKPLEALHHTLIKVRPKARVYKLELAPGQSVECTYNFWGIFIMFTDGQLEITCQGNTYIKHVKKKEVVWREGPITLTQRNVGQTTFQGYIFEYLKY